MSLFFSLSSASTYLVHKQSFLREHVCETRTYRGENSGTICIT